MQAASLALALLLGSGEPEVVLYDFGRPGCIYCQQINPAVDRLIDEGHPIVKVNCDEQPELARQYQVRNLPTFVLVVNGEVIDSHVGATSEQRLREMLAHIPEEPSDRASGGASGQASSAAPPASRHVVLGESGQFPESGEASPAESRPMQPRSEAASPPIPPAQGVPRDRTQSPSLEFVQNPATSGQANARANLDDVDTAEIPEGTAVTSMAASVRIRVIHSGRVNLGSGSLIVSQPGRSLVMTCGHIFREHAPDTKIEVDVFVNGESITYVGTLTEYDLEAEIGLITIPTDRILPVATIAPRNRIQQVHDRVASIGCSGGESPSREQHRITAINKYEGPDNLECTGTPVEGRSGGGLYNSQEELIGVCFARGESEPLGLYAGPAAIYAMLDKYGLADLYAPDTTQPAQPALQVADAPTGSTTVGAGELQGQAFPAVDLGPRTNQPLHPFAVSPEVCTPETCGPGAMASTTEPPLDFDAGNAEVVCLITQADGSRRVVVLHRASPKFVAYLTGELSSDESITLLDDSMAELVMDVTSQRIARPSSSALMSFAVASSEAEPRAYTAEGFQTTSLVQPMAPRPYVRHR